MGIEVISNEFAGYFNRDELNALGSADAIPGLRLNVDTVRLARVSRLVIEGLLDGSISEDKPVELHSQTSFSEDVISDSRLKYTAYVGSLDSVRINDAWIVDMDVLTDRLEDKDEPVLTDPALVRCINLSILPTKHSSDSLVNLQEEVLNVTDPMLVFARKNYYDNHWSPLSIEMPYLEQTRVLMLIGNLVKINLPHK